MAIASSLPVRNAIRESQTGLPASMPQHVTLLQLVVALGCRLDDDRDVVEAIRGMLARGQVRLVGNFRNEPLATFELTENPPESS